MLRDRDAVFTLVVGSTALFTIGLFLATLGPLLPELASRSGTPLAVIGSLITGLFLGALPSQLVAGPVNDRIGPRLPLAIGFVLVAFAAVALAVSTSLPVLILATVLVGVGNGFAAVTVNLLVVRTFHERSLGALNLVNLFYGVGAILGPLSVAAAVTMGGSGLPVFLVLPVVMLAQLALVPFLKVPPPEPTHPQASQGKLTAMGPVIWIVVLVVLVYAGTENGLAAWATAMIERGTGTDRATAALVMSVFWFALTSARLVLAVIGTRVGGVRVLVGCLLLASVGASLLALGHSSLAVSAVAFTIMGFAFGPIFPTALAVAGQIAPRLAGISTSIIIAGASLGSMVTPLVLGAAIDGGGAAAGSQVVLGAHVILLALIATALLLLRSAKAAQVSPFS